MWCINQPQITRKLYFEQVVFEIFQWFLRKLEKITEKSRYFKKFYRNLTIIFILKLFNFGF